MEKEPQPQEEKNIDSAELAALVENLLQESSKYNVDCLDLKDEIVSIVLNWFEERKDELAKNFKESYPQTYPPKQELLDNIKRVFPPDRIHTGGAEPEFRQIKIVDNWVSEIYNQILNKIFKE